MLIFLVAVLQNDTMIRHAFATNYSIHTMPFDLQAVDMVCIIEGRE